MTPQTDFQENVIMVVDDTESMAICVKGFLQAMGYAAIETFGCPQKALDRIRERGCPGFIVTDYEMPAMTGVALLDSITQLYPQSNGVIMTCHSAIPPAAAARYTVIRKDAPDFFGRLLRHVREELAPKGPVR